LSKKRFSDNILKWHKKEGRSFPWRYNDDPYKVLVSELLLQKTDAPKVEAIYNKFFSKYPTIYDINDNDISDIENILEPLGLFRSRAERLKSIAHTIINDFSGQIPHETGGLLKLKGVGDYITNAVLCFAYGESEPIVDANVIRIFARLFEFQSKKKRPRNDKEVWQFAESLLPKRKVQDYNYGLLDFASKVCKARKPDCDNCMFLNNCSFGKKFLSI